MQYAAQQDQTLSNFFRTHWQVSLNGVPNRPHRPTYKLGTTPPRNTLERLVFEAMGSTANPTDFVLCDDEINNYKKKAMGPRKPYGSWKIYSCSLGSYDRGHYC